MPFLIDSDFDGVEILQEKMAETKGFRRPDVWVGTGGTFTTLAAMVRKIPWTDRTCVHGTRVSRKEIRDIGGELADFCVLTSDNPRSEDPMEILAEIEAGIKPTDKPYVVIENRREAIRYAMMNAREGDVIILAGKGHETYQEINGVKHPFDDRAIVRRLCGRAD